MRISDWSSDVCSSDLPAADLFLPVHLDADARHHHPEQIVADRIDPDGADDPRHGERDRRLYRHHHGHQPGDGRARLPRRLDAGHAYAADVGRPGGAVQLCALCRRSEEHTSELQSLMRISYAVFCLKKKNNTQLIILTIVM